MKKELVELKINGRRQELAIEPSALLLDNEAVERTRCGCVDFHYGCEPGALPG
ncbi:MAG: hypothetical protein ABR880_11915 [Candidatus Sulfotelmatobacter sp.]|jgi:hypothetical protein